MPTRTRLVAVAALALLVVGCDQEKPTKEAAGVAKEGSKDAKRPNDGAEEPAKGAQDDSATGADAPRDEGNLGKLTGKGLVAIDSILNKTPDEVDALLGKPTQTANPRVTCVRFLPDRVFFACEQEVRVYENADTQLKLIEVDFEDGRAAAVALVGLPGEGEFTPDKALAFAGLELPGEPKMDQPTDFLPPNATSVTVWGYWNSSARLLIDGLQHRVEISIVDDDWQRSKVKILVNHPLSEDQQQRVKQPKSG